MAVTSKGVLRAAAVQVQNEHLDRANTATRVGGLLRDLVDSLAWNTAIYADTLQANEPLAAAANTVAINAAIVLASAASVALTGPIEVRLPAGKFWISGTIAMLSGVTLRGAGMSKTILYMPASAYTNTTQNTQDATSVAISALGLLVAPYTPAQKITIEALTIESQTTDGRWLYPIVARNVQRLAVREVEVTGIPTGNLIALDSIVDGEISGCWLHDCTSSTVTTAQTTGISADDNRINLVSCQGLRIHHNVIEDLTLTGAAFPGGLNLQTDGINTGQSVDPPRHNLQIHDNYIRNLGEGIDCFSSECTIHSNQLIDCNNVGIKLIHGARRNHVYGNTIMRPGLAGIYMGGSNYNNDGVTGTVEYNYIHDNLIHDVNPTNLWAGLASAIRVDVSTQTYKPSRNTIARNKITGAGTNLPRVIRHDDGDENRYIDNEAQAFALVYSTITAGAGNVVVNAKRAFVRAVLNADQVINNGANNVISFKTEQADATGEYTDTTPVYTANSHRRLRVEVHVRLPVIAVGEQMYMRIEKNGSEVARTAPVAAATSEADMVLSYTMEVVPGDTINTTFQNAGAAPRTLTALPALSYLTIEEVATG